MHRLRFSFVITVGMEEEVQIVDASGELVPHALAQEGPPLAHEEGALDKEIHRCVIELKTRVCPSVTALTTALRALRARAHQRAQAQGQRVVVAGVHPFSVWHQQALHEDEAHPYYVQLLNEYQDVARGALSFGMHLHLGLPDGVPKIAVMNHLRHVLPEALALSVSSPFFEGRDTGLQSWRHSLLDRYPRMGVPDLWPDETSYQDHVAKLRALGCIAPTQGLWQDLRLHHHYGTLEVRIMDTHPDLARIGLIATLLKWEVETLVEEMRAHRPMSAWSRAWIEENKWRARRHGLGARWIAWDTEEVLSSAQHFDRWWRRVAPRAPSRVEHDHWERTLADALAQGDYAQALRTQFQRKPQRAAWVQWMADRTQASWS